MTPILEDISVNNLVPHPDNPRIVLRDDVIDSIASQIQQHGFSQAHALLVRRLGDDEYQIIAGHHRWKAAEQSGLGSVPCWVEDLSDNDAFMQLVLSNMQGELAPLEIGLHAFKAVPPAQGRSGEGLAGYARQLGKSQPYLSQLYNAATVIQQLNKSANEVELSNLMKKAQHLYEISKFPDKSVWPGLVQEMLAGDWSSTETEKRVQAVAEFVSILPKNAWLPLTESLEAYFESPQKLTLAKVNNLLTAAQRVREYIDVHGSDADSAAFETWLETGSGADSWDRRAIANWLEAFRARSRKEAKEAKSKARDEASVSADGDPDWEDLQAQATEPLEYDEDYDEPTAPILLSANWHLGKWQDHIDKLTDGEVGLLLTDPPYGMNYRSNMRKEKHDYIEGDDESAFEGVQAMLEAMWPKLTDNAHVLVFCGWKGEPDMREAVANAGYEIRGSLVWAKGKGGMGDLEGAFAPSHERIIHAVKGKPVLSRRLDDVLQFSRESSANHPTEKPVDLLCTLIDVASVEDQVVADPYGGVASTCVAAKMMSRRWWGTELSEKYWEIGDQRLLG